MYETITANHDINSSASQKPLLFISHKHCDRAIADVISAFVRNVSGGGVDVYQSSSPQFEGPRVGKELTKELEDALWRASIVILIYTSQDQDWSWCMWECGVALEPSSPDTKVVTLQCLRDEPQIFKGSVHVLAWDESSVISFAKRFADPDFFPDLGKSVTGLSAQELELSAKTLHKSLRDAIPQKQRENWNVWPYMRIQISRCVLENLNRIDEKDRLLEASKIIPDEAKIVVADSGLPQLFRLTQISNDISLRDLVKSWSEHYPGRPTDWLDILIQQIINGAFKQTPYIAEWHRFRHARSNEESILGVGRIKGDSVSLQFDIYFYGVASVPFVSTQMNALHRMYYIDLASKSAQDRNLIEILDELEARDWSRLPILDQTLPKCVIHVSDIDRFLRRRAFEKQPIESLTLADLLANEEIDKRVSGSWDIISDQSTLEEAKKLIRSRQKVQDLFVTENGSRNEPVMGWLTDRDINDYFAQRS